MTVRSFGVSALAFAMGVALSAGALAQQLGAGGAGAPGSAAPPASTSAPSGGLGNGGAGLGNGAPKAGAETSERGEETTSEEAASETTDSAEKQEPDAGAEAEKDAGKKKLRARAAVAAAAEEPAVPTDELTGNLSKVSLPGTSGNSGGLNYNVPIEVPGFRGLEPRIGLSYNSSRKTKLSADYQGWLGYGWGLDGFDVIERASPRQGLPGFDGSDIFLFNGIELVPCAQAAAGAPSCSTGGTHVTETESYRRVRYDAGVNGWSVSDRDGTVSTFRSIAEIANANLTAGTAEWNLGRDARWLLTAVTDARGNTVSYGYNCSEFAAAPLTGVCYPSTISYAGGRIDFFLEVRPDQILMANGRDISVTTSRINSIRVLSGGQLMAGYSLAYDQAPFSNASRLTKVTLHGKDATVAANGFVSGGTSKPIAQMTYRDTAATYQTSAFSKNTALVPDRNFDGKDELFGITSKIASHYVLNPDGSITEEGSSDNAGNDGGYYYRQYYFGRFHPDRNFVDSVGTRVYRRTLDISGNYAYRVERHFAQTGAGLGAGSETSCDAATGANAPYAGPCSELPDTGWSDYELRDDYYRQRIVIDDDGDGVDRLLEADWNGWALLGLGDFGGAGRQQAILVRNDGKTVIAKVSGNDFASDKILPGIGCGYSRFSSLEQNCQIGDLNGDGVSDVVRFERATDNSFRAYLYLFTGTIFKETLNGAISYRDLGKLDGYRPNLLTDYNNDGTSDVVLKRVPRIENRYDAGPLSLYSLRFGQDQSPLVQFTPFNLSGKLSIEDVNGDGLPDIQADAKNAVHLSVANGANPDLLTNITTSLGGNTSISYAPSPHWQNGYMPGVMHAVTKLSVNDGRGQIAETRYAYSGGLYDPKARKFLGYRTVVETRPLANGETAPPTVETTYRQDVASAGLPELIVYKDGSGAVRKTVDEVWTVNTATKPYTALNFQTDTTLTDGVTARTLRVQRLFDAYGNLTHEFEHGRIDASGDERLTWNAYDIANTGAYIVDKPRARITWAGLESSGPAIRYQHFWYDNNSSLLSPPTKGLLTQQGDYSGAVWMVTANSYDSYGNRVATVDSASNRTEWDYDPTYRLYPVRERAPRYFAVNGFKADPRFVTTTAYNFACGAPSSQTDWNGIVTTTTYDAFCRPARTTNTATGHYRAIAYHNEGNPGTQTLLVSEPAPNGAGESYASASYDGLGRVRRQAQSTRVGPGSTILVDTDYDARGNVARKTHPFYEADSAYWTTTSYDWTDRPVRIVNPDGSARTMAYYPESQTLAGSSNVPLERIDLVDELGRNVHTTTSTFGDVIRVSKKVPEWPGYQEEYRSYDPLRRLTGVRDAGGAAWTNSYDLVGNRTVASDPDLGTWSYRYDGMGRVIEQTDARGAVTYMRYDQMGRLLERRIISPAAGQAMPTDPILARNIYDQAKAGYYNVGKLTRSENGQAVHTIDYAASGSEAVQSTVIGNVQHAVFTAVDRGGSVCLNRSPLDLSGFLPGLRQCGALRFCHSSGRA